MPKTTKGRPLPRCDAHIQKEAPCSLKPVEERRWAGHNLIFCATHAELWDDVITWALTDFYTEYAHA